MVVDLFKHSPYTGGICFATLATVIAAAYLFKQNQWVPTVMFGSAIILFGVGAVRGDILVEGLAVMVAVILATGVAFVSEYKSDREFEILNAHKDSIKVKGFRSGQIHSLTVEDVSVGDVILLETGDEIPADGRTGQGHRVNDRSIADDRRVAASAQAKHVLSTMPRPARINPAASTVARKSWTALPT